MGAVQRDETGLGDGSGDVPHEIRVVLDTRSVSLNGSAPRCEHLDTLTPVPPRSDCREAVLDQTRRLAALTGATVHVLHAQARISPPPHSTLGYLASRALTTEPTGDASAAARRMVDDAVASLSRAGVQATGLLLECTPENTPQAVRTRLWTLTSS
jgi:hypothetical protein